MQWVYHRSGAAACVDPDRGGAVHRVRLVPREEQGDAIDVLAGDAVLPEEKNPRRCDEFTRIEEPGATDRSVDLNDPGAAEDPGMFRGRILLPFNDRIPRGTYTWRGSTYRLPVNDPDSGDAIHGFLYHTRLQPVALPQRAGEAVDQETTWELRGDIHPRQGYPFPLAVRLVYRLRRREFSLALHVTNRGDRDAPVAMGWHPYFMLPEYETVDSLNLCIPADRYHPVDERLIPTGETRAVAADGLYDFREPRPIGTRDLDMAWRMSRFDPAPVVLSGKAYRLELRMAGAFRTVQVFVPPGRGSIALEPVSGPADAFNHGDGPEPWCLVLAPGETAGGRARVTVWPCSGVAHG